SPRQSRARRAVRSGTLNLRQLVTAGLLSLLLPTAALADAGSLANSLPSQATISHGRADISVTGADMHIQQHSHQLIANWQNFSIGENNSVTFFQPGADSVALNRVLGQDPSQ